MICHFTTSIVDILTCCQDGKFDNLGFPINECVEFPCEKYKKILYGIENEERTVSDKDPEVR